MIDILWHKVDLFHTWIMRAKQKTTRLHDWQRKTYHDMCIFPKNDLNKAFKETFKYYYYTSLCASIFTFVIFVLRKVHMAILNLSRQTTL